MFRNSNARRKIPAPSATPAIAAGDTPGARSGPLLQLVPNLRDDSAVVAAFSDLEADFFRRGDELEAEVLAGTV